MATRPTPPRTRVPDKVGFRDSKSAVTDGKGLVLLPRHGWIVTRIAESLAQPESVVIGVLGLDLSSEDDATGIPGDLSARPPSVGQHRATFAEPESPAAPASANAIFAALLSGQGPSTVFVVPAPVADEVREAVAQSVDRCVV